MLFVFGSHKILVCNSLSFCLIEAELHLNFSASSYPLPQLACDRTPHSGKDYLWTQHNNILYSTYQNGSGIERYVEEFLQHCHLMSSDHRELMDLLWSWLDTNISPRILAGNFSITLEWYPDMVLWLCGSWFTFGAWQRHSWLFYPYTYFLVSHPNICHSADTLRSISTPDITRYVPAEFGHPCAIFSANTC